MKSTTRMAFSLSTVTLLLPKRFNMKVVFFGTPDFALPIFEALRGAHDMQLVAVVTQPDQLAGRKHVLTPPPVKVAAEEAGISVFQFPSLKKPEVAEGLKKLEADIFVVFSYGKIIPKTVLSIPRLGCINVHPSLLPLYRGPTPVPTAILHGDAKTGVSIMLLDEGMDTGPILAQTIVDILPDDTTPTLMRRLIGFIKGDEPAEIIERKIRAYMPWPGCYTIIKHAGKELRVKLLPNQMVQPEGKKPMPLAEFERGYGKLFDRTF